MAASSSLTSPEVDDVAECFLAEARIFQNNWTLLPSWACCLVRLGAHIAGKSAVPYGPSTLVIVLPTRSFAAALCAVGAVLRRLAAAPKADPVGRFALLQTLQAGTMVSFRTKTGSRFLGMLIRCEDDTVVVKPSVGATFFIHKRFAHDIDILGPLSSSLPEHATSKSPPEYGAFLPTLLGRELLSSFQGSSRINCGIVGTEVTLRAEIQNTRLGLAARDGEIVEGTMQEILRVRRFSSHSTVFFSDVFSTAGNRRKEMWSEPPQVAIFDGAKSFLRHGATWPATNRIILLDRTDRRLTDALAEVNREYLQRDVNDVALDPASLGTPAIESLLYRTRLP